MRSLELDEEEAGESRRRGRECDQNTVSKNTLTTKKN